ncbi:MAG: hypothetical protein IJW77_07350 [Clostridia bacterium]|nr:hypothetical protein [Clostridia bacterium]
METYQIHVLSNTHWDREWYMSHEKYLVRLVSLMDRLLDILAKNPEYIFITDGQFSMVDDYLQNRPERAEELRGYVREGRLRVGPWFTQPLETLVSGEAMIRNLHYGIKGSEELGGAMRFSYEVDEFGHASQTPQVLRGFGIEGAIAWRGVPKGCRSAFEWVSPDGTSVIMLNSNDGYGEATALPMGDEDFTEVIDGVEISRAGLDKRVQSMLNLRIPRADSHHLMWLNGIDHSFAQPDLLAVLEKINEKYPNLNVRQSTCEDYMQGVVEDLAARGIAMERVEGELMYTGESILESTHACHPRQKQRHYRTERFLERKLEPMTAMAWLSGFDGRVWAQDRAWKYVLENHAHDTLGCTSVDEVYEQAMARYGCALSLAEQVTEDCRRDVMSRMADKPSMVVFNTSSFPVEGVYSFTMDIPQGYGSENFVLQAADGSRIPLTIVEKCDNIDVRFNPRRGHPTNTPARTVTALAELPEIAPFGWMRFDLIRDGAKQYSRERTTYHFSPAAGVLENTYLRCEIMANGTVTMTDKQSGKTYPEQFMFEDTGDTENVYVHIPPFEDRCYYSKGCQADVCMLYDTPLGCKYEISLIMRIPDDAQAKDRRDRHMTELPITYTLFLGKNSRHLDAEVTIDNRARQHRLRVLFPTYFEGAETSRGGQPFDVVSRPIYEENNIDGLAEQPWPTHPMQDICDVAGEGAGLTVAAEGIYEYECIDIPSRPLALTLLRCNNYIYQEWTTLRPEAAENEGRITYKLALFPHDGDWREVYGDAIGYLTAPHFTLNRQPEESVMTDYIPAARTFPDAGSALSLAGDDLMITAVKQSYRGDSLIVRVLNYGDGECVGRLTLSFPDRTVAQVYKTDLDENRTGEIANVGNSIVFALRASGLATFEIVME